MTTQAEAAGRLGPRSAAYGLGALVTAGALVAAGMALAPALSPAAASAGSLGPARCSAGAATVTVGGQATVNGTPNQADLSIGVEDNAPTAAGALAENAQHSSTLVARLKKDGIPASRIQTSGISVQPNYNNNGNIDGYQVSNSLTVTLYDIASAGDVIDTVTAIAGNSTRVDGISFSIRNQDGLMGQARQAAVRDAMSQAALMASASGSHLGSICSLKDQSSQSSSVAPEPFASSGLAEHQPAEPIEAGSLQMTANVTVVVELLSGR